MNFLLIDKLCFVEDYERGYMYNFEYDYCRFQYFIMGY